MELSEEAKRIIKNLEENLFADVQPPCAAERTAAQRLITATQKSLRLSAEDAIDLLPIPVKVKVKASDDEPPNDIAAITREVARGG